MPRFISVLSGLLILALLYSLSLAGIPKLINYQGMLTDNSGTPLTDTLNLTFKIYDDPTTGNKKWEETQNNIPVINGLFNVILGSVTPIDTLSFNQQYWLDMTVGAEHMPTRLKFTSVGYAYRAQWSDTASYARSGGGGSGSPWIFRTTDTADTTITTGGVWGIARYGNTLFGNTDSTHVNLGVASTTGTNGQNYKYCTVGGGVNNVSGREFTTIGGGRSNIATGAGSTVAGGDHNSVSGGYSSIGGGYFNSGSADYVTVGGGINDTASGYEATVGGGGYNTASGMLATIGGGQHNRATNSCATLGGGLNNTASGQYTTIAGGYYNAASNNYATVGGGYTDTASDYYATVGGGYHNIARGYAATVSGGDDNTANQYTATVGGGWANAADTEYATVGGGLVNTASGWAATVGGGHYNGAIGPISTIPGGSADTVAGLCSFAAGSLVKIAIGADYTFAFGRQFTTSTPNAVIFHNSVDPIKVGIGTPDPERILHIKGVNPRILIEASSISPEVNFKNSDDTDAETWALYKHGTTDDFRFYQNGDKVTIQNSTGNVGIGTTDPGSYKLAVNGSAAKTGGGSWDVFSDIRLKEVKASYEYGLPEISKLNPVHYRYKEDNALSLPTNKEFVGLIAQDVEKVIPEAVNKNNRGYLMLNNDPIIWAMLNTIKELKVENELLRKRVEVLESK